jgi:tetratricopeptide (TPR) repeat protein
MKATGIVSMIALIVVAGTGPARSGEDGGAQGPFTLGAGCRQIAMGGAASSIWSDSYSLLWNPAGLYRLEQSEVSLFHTSFFESSNTYSSLILGYPSLDFGVISVGAVQLRIGEIERRDAENRLFGGELKNIQTRYFIGYAKEIYRGFAGGLSLKLDRYVQGSYVANGFGLDLGLGFRTSVRSPAIDGLALGFSLVNLLEPEISLVEEQIGDPRGVRFGMSLWRSISETLQDDLTVSLDLDKTKYSDLHFHIGGEYRAYDVFAVRGGWDAGMPTFGCGFQLNWLNVDYAYRSTDLGGNHLFSLVFRFGSPRSKKLERRRLQHDEDLKRQVEEQMSRFEEQFIGSALEAGEEAVAKGEYEAAADHFQRVLLWAPENEQAKEGLTLSRASQLVVTGDTLIQDERYAEALFSYRRAYELIKATEIQQRIQKCEQRIAEAGDRRTIVENILARSLELYTNREWFDAAKGFEKVLELEPHHELAALYLKKTNAKIQERYEAIIARAERLITQRHYTEALEILRVGLNAYPGDGKLESMISEVGTMQQKAVVQRREANRRREQQVALSEAELEQLQLQYERGVSHFKNGNFSRAIAEWEQVWHRYPHFEKVGEYLVKAYQYRGMELYAQHQYEDALEIWDRVLDVDPENEKAIRYINRTKEELSRLEGYTGR